jgi:hypothetical protein
MTEYRNLDKYPGYRVGDDGSVWSCLTRKCAPKGTWKPTGNWRQLKPAIVRGYSYVTLTTELGERKNLRVHLLVLEAFRGPRPEGMQGCHHPDNDPTNCRLDNLRWDTCQSNHDDKRRLGTTAKGSRVGSAKLSEKQVVEIFHKSGAGTSRVALAKEYGVTPSNISQIATRKKWRHVTAHDVRYRCQEATA